MFFISIITKAELLSHPAITKEEIENIEGMLLYMTVVPFDDSICELAAEIRRTYTIKLPDAAIAATAIHKESTLLTRNVKDFREIKELEVQSV